jgi:hypothetical protein
MALKKNEQLHIFKKLNKMNKKQLLVMNEGIIEILYKIKQLSEEEQVTFFKELDKPTKMFNRIADPILSDERLR